MSNVSITTIAEQTAEKFSDPKNWTGTEFNQYLVTAGVHYHNPWGPFGIRIESQKLPETIGADNIVTQAGTVTHALSKLEDEAVEFGIDIVFDPTPATVHAAPLIQRGSADRVSVSAGYDENDGRVYVACAHNHPDGAERFLSVKDLDLILSGHAVAIGMTCDTGSFLAIPTTTTPRLTQTTIAKQRAISYQQASNATEDIGSRDDMVTERVLMQTTLNYAHHHKIAIYSNAYNYEPDKLRRII